MTPVADDVEEIARHLKRLEEARREMLERPLENDDNPTNSPMWGIRSDLPSDVEPCACEAEYRRKSKEIADYFKGPAPPSIYNEAFWAPLIRDGVVKWTGEA